jgi:NAD-dependent DNA ligase
MRRLERGASYVPLIIVVVLLIVAVVWAYTKHDEADQLQKKVRDLEAQAVKERNAKADAEAYLTKLGRVVGFQIQTNDPDAGKFVSYGADVDAIGNFLRESISALKDKYTRTFPQHIYTFDDDGGIRFSAEGDKVTVGYIPLGQIPSDTSLELLYSSMQIAMTRMLNDITRYVKATADKQTEIDTKTNEFRTTLETKDSTIADLRDQYNTLQSNAATAERGLRDQIATLNDQVRAAEDKADSVGKEKRELEADMKNQILALKQDIRRLKQRKEMVEKPIGPDGKVLSVSEDQGIVVINRGKDHHLQAQTTFDVYTYGKGAQKVYKGTIIVLDVDDYVAKARVLMVNDPMRPLTAGDEIESLTYNPNEKLNFVLIGRFHKYGRSDAKRRLEDLGLGVSENVTIETDYLVLGTPDREDENLRDTDDYKRAQELGIRIITEEQLSTFLRY